jgi:hypothetical protein
MMHQKVQALADEQEQRVEVAVVEGLEGFAQFAQVLEPFGLDQPWCGGVESIERPWQYRGEKDRCWLVKIAQTKDAGGCRKSAGEGQRRRMSAGGRQLRTNV